MPRYSLKQFQSSVKPRASSHLDLDFSSLGSEAERIHKTAEHISDPLQRIQYARTECKGTIEAFVNSNFSPVDNTFSIKIIDSILSSIHKCKLSTVDGEDYSYSRAKADLDKLDPSKMSPLEYLEARNNLGSLISPGALYTQFAKASDHNRGVHEFLVCEDVKYLEKQYTAPAKFYCKLVPLYLQPFKTRGYYDTSGDKVHVPYMHWQPLYLFGITKVSQYLGMYCAEPRPSDDEILAARNIAMVVQTGDKAGSSRNPASYFGFPGKNHALGRHQTLSRIMLAQTWAAHPNNRSTTMVLDPYNWDNFPPSLVPSDVLSTVQESESPTKIAPGRSVHNPF